MQLFENLSYVKRPNLPERKVRVAAISESAGECLEKLHALGIETVNVSSHPALKYGIASHADIQLLHLGGSRIISASEHLCGVENYGLEIIKEEHKLNAVYPGDVPLNSAIIGNKIICNKKTASRIVLEYAEKNGFTVIDVKQGYSRCSVAVLSENAIITDDSGIYKSAQFFFNDATLIEKNSIELQGYGYGFIGGCCGLIAKDTLAFSGSIMSHSSHNDIIDALNRSNIKAEELCSGRLKDIGGILPLIEESP